MLVREVSICGFSAALIGRLVLFTPPANGAMIRLFCQPMLSFLDILQPSNEGSKSEYWHITSDFASGHYEGGSRRGGSRATPNALTGLIPIPYQERHRVYCSPGSVHNRIFEIVFSP
jgi:hypothetical protein